MKRIMTILSSLLFIFTGCSGAKSTADTLKLEIITQQADSWVDLMPGSKPSFFISGSIKIRNNEDIPIDSIRLLRCNVLQEGKILYELHPGLNSTEGINAPLIPGADRIFTFNLPQGTLIKKELNLEKTISIDLHLSALNKVKLHLIDSIQVIKAY
jgi:hypothetical protein